jgi:acrylyl-CoA reductase (NADPH)
MFRAIRVTESEGELSATVDDSLTDDDLGDGDVTIDVEYSSVNFKDGLALTGRPGIIAAPPLIAGIDLVGTVSASESERWSPGDRVLVNGWGIGEKFDGGLSERARAKADWLVALPEALSAQRAAAIGTAGFTAMLSVLALEKHGARGTVLVTGATGGVGSIAIALLSRLGYEVTAATGKESEHDYLRSLGASSIIHRDELSGKGKALQSQRWDAAIDSVGSHTLANVLAQVNYGGIVASCGLAQGPDLPATVMPFILRSVTLAGINSVYCPQPLREEAWSRLATDLDLDLLDSITATVPLDGAIAAAERIMAGGVRGRTVVDVRH